MLPEVVPPATGDVLGEGLAVGRVLTRPEDQNPAAERTAITGSIQFPLRSAWMAKKFLPVVEAIGTAD